MLSVNSSGELALIGGVDGIAGVYSLSEERLLQPLKGGGGAITDAVWARSRAVVATSAGRVKVFEGPQELATFGTHAGEVTSIALHPSGDILASAGVDKSYVLYDLESMTSITQIYSTTGMKVPNSPCGRRLTFRVQPSHAHNFTPMATSSLAVAPTLKSKSSM